MTEQVPFEEDALEVFALSEAMVPSRALHVAAELGIADHFTDAARPVTEVAEATGTDPVALGILLRLLAGYGLFVETTTGTFDLTPRGALLRSDHPRSLRAVVRVAGSMYDTIHRVDHSLRTGQSAFELLHGQSFFEYLRTRPEESAVFDTAMADLSRFDQVPIVDGYDFSAHHRIVDVAGGDGTLLNAILARHPDSVGVLFDQKHVTANVTPTERLEVVAGDFFDDIVSGGDLYLMKSIIHDWPDEDAVTILRNCRKAMPPHGKLVLFERMLTTNEGPTQNNRWSLYMYAVLGARERTRDEFEQLFAASGFELSRTVPLGPVMHAVEAVPVGIG